jgi:hypothetical protein
VLARPNSNLVNRDNVRMLQGSCGHSFGPKPLD